MNYYMRLINKDKCSTYSAITLIVPERLNNLAVYSHG